MATFEPLLGKVFAHKHPLVDVPAISTTYLPLVGGTLTGGLTLATNSLTVFPIKFVAGPLLTTPVAGVMEFDGTNLYITV